MQLQLQYMGKLLFWTFMSVVPDAPASGRSLAKTMQTGLLEEVMMLTVMMVMVMFILMLMLMIMGGVDANRRDGQQQVLDLYQIFEEIKKKGDKTFKWE